MKGHPCAGSREQGVVLADVVVTHPLAERDAGREDAGAADDHLRELGEAVAAKGVRDNAVSVAAAHVERDREAERDRVTERAECRCGRAPCARSDEDRREESEPCDREERVDRREREPVDVRTVDHGDFTGA